MNAIIKFVIITALVLGVISLIQVVIPETITTSIHDGLVFILGYIYMVDPIIPAVPIITSLKVLVAFFAGLVALVIVIWLYEGFKD